jgi:hypothetical protein
MLNRFNRSSIGRSVLTNEALKATAPSVFAESAMQGVSAKYSFLPTIKVVEAMRVNGWAPVWASEQRVKAEHRLGFQKHMIRFQRFDTIGKFNEFTPEVCLVNSHDAGSAYQIHAGIFRLICGNGMIVADTTFEKIALRHVGFNPDQVIEASAEVIESIPALTDSVESFRARQLSPLEQRAFAEASLLLKYDELEQAPVSAQKLLDTRRTEDKGDDMWRTLNRVQENLVRGGQKDFSKRKTDGKRFGRSRGVNGIDESVKLNKALWHLANVLKGS